MYKTLITAILIFLFVASCKKEKELVYEHKLFGEWELTSQYFEGKEQVPLAIYKWMEVSDSYVRDANGNIIYDIYSDNSMVMIHGYISQLALDTILQNNNILFIFNYNSSSYSYGLNVLKIALNETDTLYGSWRLNLPKQEISISVDTLNKFEDRWTRYSEPLFSKFFDNVYIKNNKLTLANETEEFVLTKQ